MSIATLILALVHDVLAIVRDSSKDAEQQKQAILARLDLAQQELTCWDAAMNALQGKLDRSVPR